MGNESRTARFARHAKELKHEWTKTERRMLKQYCDPKDIYMDTLCIVPSRSRERTTWDLYWKSYTDQQSKRKTHRQIAERDGTHRLVATMDWL